MGNFIFVEFGAVNKCWIKRSLNQYRKAGRTLTKRRTLAVPRPIIKTYKEDLSQQILYFTFDIRGSI